MNLNGKNKETYWQERAEQRLINAENLTSDMLTNLKKTYEQAIKSIQKEINAFYGKYSTETGLDITEVRKRLDKSELKEFKKQLQLYYDEVKRLGGYTPDTKQYLRELSAKAYISRLEELQANIRWEVESLYRQQQLRLFEVLSKGYEDTYYRANFDVQQGIGFAYSFTALNTKAVQKAVTQKWQGSNFSERIWTDKVKLIDTLNQTIPQGIALGQNPRKVARNIAKTMETKFSNAERLARTEMNHICNDATRDAYKETPEVLQQYKVIATLDNRTSEICFVGTDKVQTVSDVEKLFKRNYTGKIITITTASGNQITGTPNHPVLTSEGWLSLDEINPNEHIIYSVLNETIGITSTKNVNVPTKFAKLFNSISKIARCEILSRSASTTKLNDNIAIEQSEICIFDVNSILRNWRQTIFNKHIIKNFFAFIHNSINLFAFRLIDFLGTRNFIKTTASEVKIFSFSKRIEPTFRPIKFFNNNIWINSIIKHLNGFNPINIIIFIVFTPLKIFHNSNFLKKISNSGSSSPILFCEFTSGHTIPILADNVIGKSVKFANNCHVYNLQTKDNVYINNKIIVHNCQAQDNKVYKMSEWQEGVTAPPFHPNCFDRLTQVMTNNGFKYFIDLKIDDKVLTLNPETLETEYQKPITFYRYRYSGYMLLFEDENTNLKVTPEHNMLESGKLKKALLCEKIYQDTGKLEFINDFNKKYEFNGLIKRVKYDDDVFCVEVEKYNTLLVKRKNKYTWAGNCRTTTVPYFDDVDLSDYTRLATDYSTGQAYYVPANMSYKEWRASLTEKQDKAFIANKKAREQHSQDVKQLAEYRKLKSYADKHGQSELFAGVPTTIKQYQVLKYAEPEKYEILKENARIVRSEIK